MAEEASGAARLGVIVYSGETEIEALFGALRERLAKRGDLEIGGMVPRWGRILANGRREMLLQDLAGDTAISISQELGVGADSCILDVDGLTRARLVIMAAIERGVDLVVVGKFAKQEAAGHGVREEIAAAMLADLPALVALRDTQLDAWCAFAGDDWQRLSPDVEAVLAWIDRVVAAPT